MTEKAQQQRETSLIEENMGLVFSLAKKFRPPNDTEFEEYVQAGRIGCMKAIRTWEEEKATFSTWAYKHISWEIIRYINGKCGKGPEKTVSLSKIVEPSYWENKSILLESLPEYLTEEEQSVVVLRIHGHTLSEIADIMKMNTYCLGKVFQSAVDKIRDANNNE